MAGVSRFVSCALPGELMRSELPVLSSASFVVVEGPIYRVPKVKIGNGDDAVASLRGYHERAGLWWMVTHRLFRLGVPCAIASPSSVKMFATGKGNASKDAVFAAMVRAFPAIGTNDEADAMACAAMGAQKLGVPVLDVTDYRRRAVAGVEWWPEVELARLP